MAIEALDRATRSDPRHADAHLFRHVVLSAKGDEAGAEEALAAALAAAPDQAATLERHAFLLAEEGRTQEAVDAFLRAAATSRTDAARWYRAGQACYEFEAYGKALGAIARAVELGRRDVASLVLLAELHKRGGSMERAVAALDEALRVDPRDPKVWRTFRHCGQLWGPSRSTDEIARILVEHEAKRGACAASAAEIGFCLAAERRFEDAGAHYGRALGFEGQEGLVYRSLWEIGLILERDFRQLEHAVLRHAPHHGGLMEITAELDARARERQARNDEFRRWARSVTTQMARTTYARSHGASYVAGDVNDAMRDWQSQQAGMLGAVGLQFMPPGTFGD
jgi:tetratricopeptide (TPR) repeat protein